MNLYKKEEKRKNFMRDSKYFDEASKVTVIFECSCRTIFENKNMDYKICRWCGKKIYRDKKTEFKEKIKEGIENYERNIKK